MDEPSQKEILWRQYNLHVDLYKYYFDLAIKANSFFFTITGAMVAFYFANSAIELVKYSLLLPAIMSIALGISFMYGGVLMGVIRTDIFDIRDKLSLQAAPDVQVLTTLLRFFGAIYFAIATVLILLVFLM
jgi:hypothetical protein